MPDETGHEAQGSDVMGEDGEDADVMVDEAHEVPYFYFREGVEISTEQAYLTESVDKVVLQK